MFIFWLLSDIMLCAYKDEKYKDTHTYRIVEEKKQMKKLIVN